MGCRFCSSETSVLVNRMGGELEKSCGLCNSESCQSLTLPLDVTAERFVYKAIVDPCSISFVGSSVSKLVGSQEVDFVLNAICTFVPVTGFMEANSHTTGRGSSVFSNSIPSMIEKVRVGSCRMGAIEVGTSPRWLGLEGWSRWPSKLKLVCPPACLAAVLIVSISHDGDRVESSLRLISFDY